MPRYDYQCEACEHVFDESHSIADRQKPTEEPCPFCGESKVTIAFLTAPGLCDPVRMGRIKPDNGFKEVLSKVHERMPGSNLNQSSSHL